ncbi:hypothetical protein KO566_08375 [Flavobacteriaceae bacterium XHP0103]|uniref:DUF7486 family protein n=1 Tax=Marixanthotalea marina TaxID=2844359 RepID=UPI002989F919|nr:hypothetical protein [Marixanthotalea marina]MBU3822072.1 hypothetical protein [Marixanthotalea marina]
MSTFITLKSGKMTAFFVSVILLVGCKNEKTEIHIVQEPSDANTNTMTEVIWHIKAIHPEGKLLDVKAIGEDGTIFDVKAIQDKDQRSILDIKAFVNEEQLPVKVLVSEEKYMPVKAIGSDGTILDIKALTADGDILDVKGVSQSGNIINIKVVNKEGEFYGIKAISPNGWVNDVKGVKMKKGEVEEVINGIGVYAHIKGLTQSYY